MLMDDDVIVVGFYEEDENTHGVKCEVSLFGGERRDRKSRFYVGYSILKDTLCGALMVCYLPRCNVANCLPLQLL